jgi:hypothetical protein
MDIVDRLQFLLDLNVSETNEFSETSCLKEIEGYEVFPE